MRTTWMEKMFIFVAKRWREWSLDKEKQMKTRRRWAKEKQSWAVGAQREIQWCHEPAAFTGRKFKLLFGACRWSHIKVTAWKKTSPSPQLLVAFVVGNQKTERGVIISTWNVFYINPSTWPADTLIFNLN